MIMESSVSMSNRLLLSIVPLSLRYTLRYIRKHDLVSSIATEKRTDVFSFQWLQLTVQRLTTLLHLQSLSDRLLERFVGSFVNVFNEGFI